MKRATSVAGKALLSTLLALTLGTQLLTPQLADYGATNFPEVANLKIPYAAALIAFIACAQIALICIWRLLKFVSTGSIFTVDAFAPVTLTIRVGAVGTVIAAAVFVHAIFIAHLGPFTLVMALLGGVVTAGAFTLVMSVMRELLRSAVGMRDELSELI